MKKSLVALVMAGCMIVPSMTVFASAKDSTFPSEFVSWNTKVDTRPRVKDNSSYHYVCNNSSIPLWIESIGESGTNCTKGNHAIVPYSSERFITNYVYEWKEETCFLRIYAGKQNVGARLSGRWSPDSVGSYPVANP